MFRQEKDKFYIIPKSLDLIKQWRTLFQSGKKHTLIWQPDQYRSIPLMEDPSCATLYDGVRRVIIKGESLCQQTTIATSTSHKHTEKIMRGGQVAEYIVAGLSLAPDPVSVTSSHRTVMEAFPTCSPASPPQTPIIMFLGINTTAHATLSVEDEFRGIRDELEERVGRTEALYHNRFVLHSDYFNTPNHLLKRLDRIRPSILHLACHGESDGLHFYGAFVKGGALSECFKVLSRRKSGEVPRLVVVNACNSHRVAKELAGYVEFVVGHDGLLPDKEAIGFSEAFYGQLAEGSAVLDAFDAACLPASREGYRLFAKKSDPHKFALFPGGLSQAGQPVSSTTGLSQAPPCVSWVGGHPVHINLQQPAGIRIMRKELNLKLHAWLNNSERSRMIVWGLSGSGKSTLVMKFLCDEKHSQLSRFKVVAFFRRSSLPEDYLKLAKDLFNNSSHLDNLKPFEVRDRVHCFLKYDLANRWVIAMDDLVRLDEEMLDGFPWDYGKTLVTTLDQVLDKDGKGLHVGSFDVSEACEYVLGVLPWWESVALEDILHFVQKLQLIPLSIGHAAEYCKSLTLKMPEEYFLGVKKHKMQ
jgi:hypothetical protein